MKTKNKKFFLPLSPLLFLFLTIIFLIPISVLAQAPSAPINIGNPIGLVDPRELIGRFIAAMLGLVGSIALFMFVLGGLTWMTAAGNPERVKRGRDMLIWATLGLAVIFTSYVLVQFVLRAVTSGEGGDNSKKPLTTPGGIQGN